MDTLTVDVTVPLRDFTLELALEAADTLALVGPSGAGKTTLLRAVAGLVRPERGHVLLQHEVWLDRARGIDLPPERRGVGFVFQGYALFPHLTVERNVAFGGGRARVGELLERLRISHLAHARPGDLSGGERQRVALARALARGPRVLLLDEPLAGLAAGERERVSSLVKSIAENIPVLIVEHDIDRVLGFSQRVTVMNQGEVLMAGTPDEVRGHRRVQEIYTGTGTPPVTGKAAVDPQARPQLLRFDRVNAFYGKSHILTDASLDVREGEIVALLGRNGAGKSTLLKTLAGLLPPASGEIEFAGRSIAGLPAPDIARLGIGYVPQGRGLFAGMSVAENLALGRLARATDGKSGVVWSEERIFEYFPRLKERMHVAADYLSGGEQQMAAVARALSGNVRLLLLDEPFEGLAPGIIQELFKVFDRLREHASIVIVEHNLDLVLALADRVFALERGAVFHQGPAGPLLNDLDYRKKILWL